MENKAAEKIKTKPGNVFSFSPENNLSDHGVQVGPNDPENFKTPGQFLALPSSFHVSE